MCIPRIALMVYAFVLAAMTARIESAPPASAPAMPDKVDLRPRFKEFDLPPRPQGARGTCSIFTTTEAIEFALAVKTGKGERLSPEYLNWAGSQIIGRPTDGNFFHNALAGFEKFGICSEASMPYQKAYDPANKPAADAEKEAAEIREQSKGTMAVHWIVPWTANHFGVDDNQFAEIKRVLASGYPVAAGSGHSRLLVGYRDDQGAAGGGMFITEDSALNRFDQVTYEFVRKQVADVFWVEALKPR
jgi:C1A family cysteine protease